MGYFSNMAFDCRHYEDHSITPSARQLLWRCEELQERLVELKVKKAAYHIGDCHMDADLRYVLPHTFRTVYDTEKAIELAIRDLKEKYGIDMYPENNEVPGVDEVTDNQLSLFTFSLNVALPIAA